MNRFLALALPLALAACSSIHVVTDRDPEVDFAKLRTWSWLPRTEPSDPIAENTLVTNRLRRAIHRELAAKGYGTAASGKPDFLVGFETASRDELDVTTWPSWCCAGRRRFGLWRHDVTVTRYTRGTLVVGVLDPDGRELLWRGSGSRVLTEDSGDEEHVAELVSKLFEDFPARAR